MLNVYFMFKIYKYKSADYAYAQHNNKITIEEKLKKIIKVFQYINSDFIEKEKNFFFIKNQDIGLYKECLDRTMDDLEIKDDNIYIIYYQYLGIDNPSSTLQQNIKEIINKMKISELEKLINELKKFKDTKDFSCSIQHIFYCEEEKKEDLLIEAKMLNIIKNIICYDLGLQDLKLDEISDLNKKKFELEIFEAQPEDRQQGAIFKLLCDKDQELKSNQRFLEELSYNFEFVDNIEYVNLLNLQEFNVNFTNFITKKYKRKLQHDVVFNLYNNKDNKDNKLINKNHKEMQNKKRYFEENKEDYDEELTKAINESLKDTIVSQEKIEKQQQQQQQQQAPLKFRGGQQIQQIQQVQQQEGERVAEEEGERVAEEEKKDYKDQSRIQGGYRTNTGLHSEKFYIKENIKENTRSNTKNMQNDITYIKNLTDIVNKNENENENIRNDKNPLNRQLKYNNPNKHFIDNHKNNSDQLNYDNEINKLGHQQNTNKQEEEVKRQESKFVNYSICILVLCFIYFIYIKYNQELIQQQQQQQDADAAEAETKILAEEKLKQQQLEQQRIQKQEQQQQQQQQDADAAVKQQQQQQQQQYKEEKAIPEVILDNEVSKDNINNNIEGKKNNIKKILWLIIPLFVIYILFYYKYPIRNFKYNFNDLYVSNKIMYIIPIINTIMS